MFPKHIFVALIGIAFVSVSAEEDVRVLKRHTYYNTTEEEVVLGRVGLEEIEPEAFKDVTVFLLEIDENPLVQLKKGIFVNVSVHEVYFTYNNITEIEPGTFNDLHPVEERGISVLALHYNKLGVVRKGVFSNTKFRQLYLRGNKIKHIEPGSFEGMVHLFKISLQDNFLETIDVGVFQNLATPSGWVELFFSRNNIRFVDPYAFENTTLYTLNLQDNKLRGLDSNYFKKTAIGTFLI